jgi:hypothetical protein
MTGEVNTLERREDMAADRPISTADFANREERRDTNTDRMPLFPGDELGGLRHQWQDVQSGFVDDPRNAVKHADEMVASLMTRLAQIFAGEREKLEHEWDKGENVSTEDLRVALQRYRSFFDRLLSV